VINQAPTSAHKATPSMVIENIIRVTKRGALADRIVDDITTAQQLHLLLQSSLSKELHHFGLTPTDSIPEG